jgi:hypothetical protein
MPFDESHHKSRPKTTYDQAVDAEKRRKVREYQRPFLVALGIITKEKEPTL